MWTAIRGFIVKGDVLSRDNRFSVLVQWRSCLEALTTPLIVTYIGYVFLKIYILLIIIRNYYSLYTAIGIFHAQNNGIHNIYIYIYIYIYTNLEVCHPRCVCENWKGYVVVRVSGYWYRGPGFDPRCYEIFWVVVGLERVPLSLVRSIEELLEWKK